MSKSATREDERSWNDIEESTDGMERQKKVKLEWPKSQPARSVFLLMDGGECGMTKISHDDLFTCSEGKQRSALMHRQLVLIDLFCRLQDGDCRIRGNSRRTHIRGAWSCICRCRLVHTKSRSDHPKSLAWHAAERLIH